MEVTKRIRVNLSTSVKGVVTPDVTIEYIMPDAEYDPPFDPIEIADETSALLEHLRAKYPLEG